MFFSKYTGCLCFLSKHSWKSMHLLHCIIKFSIIKNMENYSSENSFMFLPEEFSRHQASLAFFYVSSWGRKRNKNERQLSWSWTERTSISKHHLVYKIEHSAKRENMYVFLCKVCSYYWGKTTFQKKNSH